MFHVGTGWRPELRLSCLWDKHCLVVRDGNSELSFQPDPMVGKDIGFIWDGDLTQPTKLQTEPLRMMEKFRTQEPVLSKLVMYRQGVSGISRFLHVFESVGEASPFQACVLRSLQHPTSALGGTSEPLYWFGAGLYNVLHIGGIFFVSSRK